MPRRESDPRSASRIVTLAAAVGMFASVGGCNLEENTVDFDDANFDPGQATMSLGAVSSLGESPDELVFADLDGTVYTVTSSVLFVEEIELELPGHISCDDIEEELSSAVECEDEGSDSSDSTGFGDDTIANEGQLTVTGPFVLDLMTGQTEPDLGDIRIPAVNYDEIDVELQPADSDHRGVQPGDEIVGHTWVAHATFRDEAQNTRELVIRLDFEDEVDIEPGDGIEVNEDEHLTVEFDVARWMENIPLSECLRDGVLKTSGSQVFVTDDTDAGACLDMESRLVDTLKLSAGTRTEQP